MTRREKEIQFNLETARKVGKTVEFIATFASILAVQLFFGIFMFSIIAGIIAYAIVNSVLEINLQSIKKKLGL